MDFMNMHDDNQKDTQRGIIVLLVFLILVVLGWWLS